MAPQIGLFFEKHFKNKVVEIYTGDEADYIHYNDTDTFNRSVIYGTFVEYDADCGILVLKDKTGRLFYMNESNVELFWAPGFNLLDSSKSTIMKNRPAKQDKDIM